MWQEYRASYQDSVSETQHSRICQMLVVAFAFAFDEQSIQTGSLLLFAAFEVPCLRAEETAVGLT